MADIQGKREEKVLPVAEVVEDVFAGLEDQVVQEREGESMPEAPPTRVEKKRPEERRQPTPREKETPTIAPSEPSVEKPRELEEIEGILSEDLGKIYKTLPPKVKPQFKQRGEEIAAWCLAAIRKEPMKDRFSPERLYGRVLEWLSLIPDASKLYLNQEAKVKSDLVLARLEEQERREQQVV
jgi:hypothetical protein